MISFATSPFLRVLCVPHSRHPGPDPGSRAARANGAW